MGHAVELISLKGGPLAQEFSALGVTPCNISRARDAELIVANTVVSVPLAMKLALSADRIFAWIHESAYFFEVMRTAPGRFQLRELKFAGFPSRFQVDEFAAWIPDTTRLQLRNWVEVPNSTDTVGPEKYYVCSGYWNKQKGQDRLLRLLNHLPVTPRIYFVGAKAPSGLTSSFHKFVGQVPHDDAISIIQKSRGLISAAVSEAQNLSAIESMLLGRPVLLSDIPAHRELKELMPDLLLFDPEDVNGFPARFEQFDRQWNDLGIRARLRIAAQKYFGRDAFETAVKGVLARYRG